MWNAIQRDEAVELHRVPSERVAITGAQLFDDWFDRSPSRSREEFLRAVGLDGAERYVLYVGSSPNIAPAEREIPFVRRWLEAIRASGDPLLAAVGVLVRPHPYSTADWAGESSSEPGRPLPRASRPSCRWASATERCTSTRSTSRRPSSGSTRPRWSSRSFSGGRC